MSVAWWQRSFATFYYFLYALLLPFTKVKSPNYQFQKYSLGKSYGTPLVSECAILAQSWTTSTVREKLDFWVFANQIFFTHDMWNLICFFLISLLYSHSSRDSVAAVYVIFTELSICASRNTYFRRLKELQVEGHIANFCLRWHKISFILFQWFFFGFPRDTLPWASLLWIIFLDVSPLKKMSWTPQIFFGTSYILLLFF